jgi:SAM-dependent methyltransferase
MKVNLGCGKDIKKNWVNCDQHPLEGVNVVMNLDEFPWPFEDSSVDEIFASHVFEHVGKPIEFVLECWRILKKGGKATIVCPHWTSENAFTDPTHVRFVTDRTFDYWCEGEMLNGPLGAQFLGDTFKFRKQNVRRNGGDIIFFLRKI